MPDVLAHPLDLTVAPLVNRVERARKQGGGIRCRAGHSAVLFGTKSRQLAAELKAREEAQAEMRANYPHFKQAVYASLREQFERALGSLPDKDLETLAAEEGAQPLEAFIEEVECQKSTPT